MQRQLRPLAAIAPSQPHGHGRVAFLPFVAVRRKSLIAQARIFDPQTLGEYLKNRRLQLGITQKALADRLAVSEFTVINWERGKTRPAERSVAALRTFLGYDSLLALSAR